MMTNDQKVARRLLGALAQVTALFHDEGGNNSKMNTERVNPLIFVSSVVLALCILVTNPLRAQRVCCQGELWLKWSHSARESYVWGYTEGYTKGNMNSCNEGPCSQQQVDFSRGSTYFVKSITDFYIRYPKDRDIYIDEILDLLGKGLTLEEIHNHPFWRHKPPGANP
jgi:hypothetical protein